jgi:hypothetical protein
MTTGQRTVSWVGGVIVTAVALAAFLGLTPRVLSQVDRNATDITRNGQAIASEINRSTAKDGEQDQQQAVIVTKLDEVIRRLDRIERKVSP